MAFRLRTPLTRQLTHAGLVLGRDRRFVPILWGLLAGLATAALAIYLFFRFAPESQNVRDLSQSRAEVRKLRQSLEQSQLRVRMSEARSHELELQIDGLNQRIREMQDELAFFRKTQNGNAK